MRLSLIALLLSGYGSTALAGEVKGKVSVTGAASPVVVYVKEIAAAKPAPMPELEIVQQGMAFVPAVSVVTVGTKVEFPNKDKIYHNVFSPTDGSKFDLGLYRQGVSKNTVLTAPGEVDVYCNIHPDMAAKILVLQNDRFSMADGAGAYLIRDLPAGSYVVVAWSAAHEPVEKSVTVAATGAVVLDLTLATERPKKRHTNKDGQQHGRYK